MATKKVISAIEALQYQLENDTDVTVGQIDLLERITHNSSVKYAALNERAAETAAKAADYGAAAAELEAAQQHLDGVARYVDYIEGLTQELDQWISELEVKSKRLAQNER